MDCLFCKMASGEIPVEKIAQNDHAFAIRDINPRAPVHALVIPRDHLPTAKDIEWNHGELLAGLFVLATQVARLEGVYEPGYRLAFNVGDAAGMTIPHLHLHLLGGRQLGPEG
ncbi:MAG: histidine triad nucleotide-binding protein [Dehalococcoidia bacterium]|nr:histidine triad nucleotide-binding protein [Dehalococcoidia bacterium]